MSSLNRENRRLLENTVAYARQIAGEGARKVLKDQYAVESREAWSHMTAKERELRSQLRAHALQLGDKRESRTGIQEIRHLVEATAYEHWHRMLFARFLAENDLLIDPEYNVAMALDEVRELAQESGRDWIDIAADLAQRMLLAVFRLDDPVLKVQLPPETRQELEEKLAALPGEVFLADDSLGWVYQFWQRDEKNRVNESQVKIGAVELPAVTQLFTEDYMVLFLLENTLGAWWTSKRRAEGKKTALPGYEWTYLRLEEDGSPSAGSFNGWPRRAKELKVLDPCMGSGHFLVFALPIVTRMRMEEEGLSLKEALRAVLKENLYGLEIDARCSQIAAFNLALAAWRMAGEHFALPELQLACIGLGPNCSKDQWMKLAEEVAASSGMPAKTNLFESEDSLLSEPARSAMESLYELFLQAPVLGSLIDPTNLRGNLFKSNYQSVAKLFAGVLSAQRADENARERLIAAAGMMKAAAILASSYSLVATNVPYLGRGRQNPSLAEYCAKHHADAKADLATCFVDRCLRFTGDGGSAALVTPQNWLFLTRYKIMRERLLKREQWDFVARLGSRAFETISGEVVNVTLLGLTRFAPDTDHMFVGVDAGEGATTKLKVLGLLGPLTSTSQVDQIKNPDCRITLGDNKHSSLLSDYASTGTGMQTFDSPRFLGRFWEFDVTGATWAAAQTTVEATQQFGGMHLAVRWENGSGQLYQLVRDMEAGGYKSGIWKAGSQFWGRRGVLVSLMGDLPCTRYLGLPFDNNAGVLIPHRDDDLLPIWCFCSSAEFRNAVRRVDQKLNVTNATVGKIPFDFAKWWEIADLNYPSGLPSPTPNYLTQSHFTGIPDNSDHPLQVAVARVVGYRWPRQMGLSFPDCPAVSPDGLDKPAELDGILPINAIAGEGSAADRIRALLAAAYGSEWSAAKLQELLGGWDSLEEWLRDGFFEQHCSIFHQRPFVWHVWDGRKDGFHALVNYHKLAAPKGQGKQMIEKLIYTLLGRWIDRQNDEVHAGKEGADARLTAALHLKAELEKLLVGEKPYDIFVRWKRLAEQPTGWEPDINDGVRLNIRPWLTATLAPTTKPKKDACILRVTPKIKYGRDRGTEPHRKKEEYPWFWSWDPAKADPNKDFLGNGDFDGARWNDLHYSLSGKQDARTREARQKDHREFAAAASGDTKAK